MRFFKGFLAGLMLVLLMGAGVYVVTQFQDLDDVDWTGATNAQIPKWNETQGKFLPADDATGEAGGGITAINTLDAATQTLATANSYLTIGSATSTHTFTFNTTQLGLVDGLSNFYNRTQSEANFYNMSLNNLALGSNTTGNYVASVATTAPLTGGAAGSEGATLTIVIPKATTSVDGYLNSTDWTTFNGKMAGDLAKDLVTTAPLTGGTDNILPGTDADITVAITMLGDVVATAPLLVNGTTSVDNIWPGADVDTTFSINVLKDLVTTAPLTGGTNDVFPGTDADITVALDVPALLLHNQTKSISIYNITSSHDVLLWKTPKAITITQVDMACTGGTDVVAVLQECNVTGQACVNSNTTFWQTLAGQGTSFTTFDDAAIDAGDFLAVNVTTVNGTPANWGMTVRYDE